MNAIETSALGRRYGATWAVHDCTLAIPEGHLVALVGPNGAGKSTLLNILVGLTAPSTGEARVLGEITAGSLEALDGIAFVAQDTPLYRNLSVADMVHLTRNLNRHFDTAYATKRLADLGISPKHKAGRLSGGQQAQLSLSLALARHPRLLVLDEPTAALDPLARHDFMATVMTAMADDGVTVLLSSHLLTDLERVADYLVLMARGEVRLDGPTDELLATHRLITMSSAGAPTEIPGAVVVESTGTGMQSHRLVRMDPGARLPAGCETRAVGLEELAMAYLREGIASGAPTLIGVAR